MQSPSAEQRRSFEQAVTQYRSDLAVSTSAQAYLKSRGFGPEVASTYRLGVVGTPLSGHEDYRGRLCIPYLTPAGVVNLRFRCLQSHDCDANGHPKYRSMDGIGANLYNVLALKGADDFICIAEGELDAVSLSVSGLPAVGVPGTETWGKKTVHWSRCLEDFSKIYVFADGDKAGRKFAGFLAREVRAIPIRLPDGEDCNSLFVKEGPSGLQRLLS